MAITITKSSNPQLYAEISAPSDNDPFTLTGSIATSFRQLAERLDSVMNNPILYHVSSSGGSRTATGSWYSITDCRNTITGVLPGDQLEFEVGCNLRTLPGYFGPEGLYYNRLFVHQGTITDSGSYAVWSSDTTTTTAGINWYFTVPVVTSQTASVTSSWTAYVQTNQSSPQYWPPSMTIRHWRRS